MSFSPIAQGNRGSGSRFHPQRADDSTVAAGGYNPFTRQPPANSLYARTGNQHMRQVQIATRYARLSVTLVTAGKLKALLPAQIY
jgi:hypothetical protein